MNDSPLPRICAVVVTFNRQSLLSRCLHALQAQTRPLDTILVVDNASTDGTLALLAAEFPGVEVLALKQNGGGAGGFYAGIKRAFEHNHDWIWLMDDDGTPAPDCLEILLEESTKAAPGAAPSALDATTNTESAASNNAARGAKCATSVEALPAVLLPVQQDNLGRFYGIYSTEQQGRNIAPDLVERGETECGEFLFTFVGPLISRRVIERVGLPIREFFIWLDDTEYGLRIHAHADLPIVAVPRALFHHDPGGVVKTVTFLGRKSVRAQQPAWKIYYGARNGLYIITRAHPDRRALLPYFRKELKLLIGDLVYERGSAKRVRMRVRGICDGALGRLGKRV